MTNTTRTFALACLVASLAACGNGNGAVTPAFSIAIKSAVFRGSLKGMKPAAGRAFLDAEMTITNTAATPSINAAFTFFRLKTASALEVTASASTALAVTPCGPDLSVAPGGSLTCHVVFEAPMGDKPAQISYQDAMFHNATTPVGDVKTLYVLGQGSYNVTDRGTVENDCNLLYGTVSDLTLIVANDGSITFPVDLRGPDGEYKFVLVDNTATAMSKQSMSGECNYDEVETLTLTAIGDDTFTMMFKHAELNRNGRGCMPSDADCIWTNTRTFVKN